MVVAGVLGAVVSDCACVCLHVNMGVEVRAEQYIVSVNSVSRENIK